MNAARGDRIAPTRLTTDHGESGKIEQLTLPRDEHGLRAGGISGDSFKRRARGHEGRLKSKLLRSAVPEAAQLFGAANRLVRRPRSETAQGNRPFGFG